MTELEGKPTSESAITDYAYRIFPNDLNSHGNLFGGVAMAMCDKIASVVAERHSEKPCVTASCDSMHFVQPAINGEILVFQASVNRTWTTSMEIGVKVFADNYREKTRKHIVSSYFTFVALTDEGKPTPVPPVIPETDQQKRWHKEAEHRRQARRKAAQELHSLRGTCPIQK